MQLKLPQIQKIMMEFERQSEIMDMKEEMMNDAIDDAMGDEDDEEERCEKIINKDIYSYNLHQISIWFKCWSLFMKQFMIVVIMCSL